MEDNVHGVGVVGLGEELVRGEVVRAEDGDEFGALEAGHFVGHGEDGLEVEEHAGAEDAGGVGQGHLPAVAVLVGVPAVHDAGHFGVVEAVGIVEDARNHFARGKGQGGGSGCAGRSCSCSCGCSCSCSCGGHCWRTGGDWNRHLSNLRRISRFKSKSDLEV